MTETMAPSERATPIPGHRDPDRRQTGHPRFAIFHAIRAGDGERHIGCHSACDVCTIAGCCSTAGSARDELANQPARDGAALDDAAGLLFHRPMSTDNTAIARRLMHCLLTGDADGVTRLYHDDFSAWRNFDNRTLTRKQALKIVQILANNLQELRYDDVRVQPTPSGFVQQHVMRCTAPNGQAVEAHVCMIATLKDGKLLRVDEYMESSQMAPLMG